MRFQASTAGVFISNGENEFRCSLEDFLLIEPNYSLPEGATEVWNSEVHCYLLAGDQLPAESAAATYPTKIAGYGVALAALHPEPEPPPVLPSPNWQNFRLALLQSTTFRDWSERLPATWREDLKLAAMAANTEALQGIYDFLAHQHTPEYEAAVEWQAIADLNHISITF